MRHHERIIMLSVLDQQWKDHLLSMDHLREGIGLRGYGQHDPLVEYKRESFDMFEAMMERFEEDTVRYLYLMQVIECGDRGTYYSSGGPTDGGTGGAPGGPAVPVPAGGGDGGPASKRSRAVTSMDDMEEAFQRRKRRELEQARMAGAGEMQECSRWSAAIKSAATILALVAAARSTRSAAEPRSRCGSLIRLSASQIHAAACRRSRLLCRNGDSRSSHRIAWRALTARSYRE